MTRQRIPITFRSLLLVALLASTALFAPAVVRAATLDTTADAVLGQASFTTTSAGTTASAFAASFGPNAFAVDRSGRLFVADAYNNRVLSWPSAAAFTNGQAADLVIGQLDFTTGTPNTGGISAATLFTPFGVAIDVAGNLYVADFGNNRVLRYASPFASGMAAVQVFGQGGSFTSSSANNGGVSRSSLNSPFALHVDAAGALYIVDRGNNRVLMFTAAAAGDTLADQVYGQTNFTTSTPNSGGRSATTLNSPSAVTTDATGNLYVSDEINNRVLVYETLPTRDGTADRVYGQADFSSASSGASASLLNAPAGLAVALDGTLFVAEFLNNRVLQFNPGDTVADRVFGQPNFTTGTSNTGGISASSLSSVVGIALDNNQNLLVADRGNNRVLRFDQPLNTPLPTISSLGPNTVAAGSAEFTLTVNGTGFLSTSEVRWNGAPRPTTFISAQRLTATITAADVAAGGPFAVTVFSPAPGGGTSTLVNFVLTTRAALDTTADRVLGQPDFVSNTANNPLLGGVSLANISANSMRQPYGLLIDPRDGRLFVADTLNHRVLSWPSAAAFTNGQAADLVLGQPDFFSVRANQGGTATAKTLISPFALVIDAQGTLYVSDIGNNRVLGYSAPLTNGMAATRVFGQGGSFTTATPNNGGVSANSMSNPYGVALDTTGNLYVADAANHRVLIFNAPLNDTTADRVIGQPNFTSNTANSGGLSASSLEVPLGVFVDPAGALYVTDYNNHRALVYDAALTGDATADRVYGQAGSFTTSVANNGGLSATSLRLPSSIFRDDLGGVYIADSVNNRVLYYRGSSTTADRVFGQADFTSNTLGSAADRMSSPLALALDASRNLYVADTGNNRLLAFDTPQGNPLPTATSIGPTSVMARGPQFTLTLTGTGFVAGAVVQWNGTALVTTLVNSTQLTAVVPANLIASAGTANITVVTAGPGGGASAALQLTVAPFRARVLLPLLAR